MMVPLYLALDRLNCYTLVHIDQNREPRLAHRSQLCPHTRHSACTKTPDRCEGQLQLAQDFSVVIELYEGK